ncbi:MAG TPA: DUF1631 family protein [Xanthomonadaceae bacterium]|jgi:hypothetical protein
MSDESKRTMPAPAVARTIGDLFDGLRARLREPMIAMFDALDDTLFDLGEHAHSGEAQQHHFDALRECRRQRGGVLERFLASLGRSEADAANHSASHSQLSLVDPDDLEEDLAVDSMATRTTQRLSAALHALDQRVGWLMEETALDPQRNPFGPLAIAKSFREAAVPIDIDLQTRLVMYKIFERQVLGALEPVYAEINARLAAAGVLPMLGHARGRVTHAVPQREAIVPSHLLSPSHANVSIALEQDERDLLNALRSLLIRETATALLAAQNAAPAMRQTVPATDVMDRALARLRAQAPAGQSQPSPREIAEQLLAEVSYSNDVAPPSPQQSATVDIVGRVFDALSHDHSIPTPMQPVMQTLFLPVMRASLKHPGLIAENDHPLRQLLDLVAENAVGWCPSVDPDARALNDLQSSLQQIAVSDSAQDADQIVVQLRSQLEQQRRRSELAEQRAVEAHAGRERLWQARRQVNQALIQTIGHAPVPSWVRYLITRPWMNCLVLLWLRQGPDSSVYREALGFAESLVWCTTAGTSRVEQLRLRAMLPIMEAQLRQGLATVAYQDNEIKQLVNELQQYVRYRIGDLPPPAFIESEPPAGSAPGALSADPGSIDEQPLPQNVNPEMLARVRGLRPGTWFTFENATKGSERCKLSWVSPYSGRCLFVNRNGLKISEHRPEDLADALQKGVASIVENNGQMLQRALTQVLTQVRGNGGEAKSA